MPVPSILSPSSLTPAIALALNLLAGQASPGTATKKGLVLAFKATSGGTITPNTELKTGLGGSDDFATYLGEGTCGHLLSKAAYKEYPIAQLDLAAAPEPGGAAATGTFTFDDTTPVSAAQTVSVKIAGRLVQITWDAGVLDTDAATLMVAAINGLSSDLPVIASNGGGTLAVVTLTFKQKGRVGNDCAISVLVTGGTGGAVTASGAALTGATTDADYTTILAFVANNEYDFIVPVCSNTDVNTGTSSSNPGRVKTHINTYRTGLSAKFQQQIVAGTGAVSSFRTGALAMNHEYSEYVYCQGGRSLPCEYAGAELGARMRDETERSNFNRINKAYVATLYAPIDTVGDVLTDAELEGCLTDGVSPITYEASTVSGELGTPRISRPRVTYSRNTSGGIDKRLIDVGQVSASIEIAKDIRDSLALQYPQTNVIRDSEVEEGDELPAATVTESVVRTFIIGRLRIQQARGLVKRSFLDEVIASGELAVMVNSLDDAQVDIQVPIKIVPPTAKWGIGVRRM